MKLLTVLAEMAVVAMLVTSVGCAITADDPQDSSPAATEETAAPVDKVAVPDELQLVPATPTCRSKHGVCIALKLCNEENDHHPIPATGCSASTVCCVAG